MASAVFTAIITALDKASPVLQAIQGKAQALQKTVETPPATTGLARLRGHLEGVRDHADQATGAFGRLYGKIGGLFPVLGALGGGISAVGLFKLTREVAQSTGEADAAAKKFGITAGQLGMLKAAAALAFVPIEALEGGLGKLNKGLAEAATGGNKKLVALFRQLKIPLRDANGQLRNAADIMPDIAEAMARNENPIARARIATVAFGKAGAELIPMLQGGRRELKEFADRMRAVGFAAGPQAKKDLIEYARAWMVFDRAVAGIKTAIGAALAPVLTPVVEAMTKLAVVNREIIATSVVEVVKFTAVAFRQLGDAFRMISGVTGPAQAGILLVGAALALFSPHLALLELIGGAAFLIWKNWNEQAKPLADIWRMLKDIGSETWRQLREEFVRIGDEIGAAWGKLKETFSDWWDAIAGAFDAGWQKIKPIVDALAAGARTIGEALNWISGSGSGAGGGAGYEEPPPLPPGLNATPPLQRRGDAGGVGGGGAVDVRVSFANAPNGTQVETSSRGNVNPPRVNVGSWFGGFAGYAGP